MFSDLMKCSVEHESLSVNNWYVLSKRNSQCNVLITWTCSNACLCNDSGITICIPYRITPLITAMSSGNISCVLWNLIFVLWPALDDIFFEAWKVLMLWCCLLYLHIFMQSGMLVVVCMVSIFNCIPGISASLFSLWFCLDSQSAINRPGPDLCMILALYWCILSRIHCILCDSIAMSF